ncbi:MAG TPA: ABC transporter ATP-binding protein [Desulfuromonadales bacterium]|nr:ABC transporter ATP-binding protein [Desulfuromonadales bacterium]
MIELSSLSKVFNDGRSNRFVAVDDVSLVIMPRQLTVLKGPSGSGKTTLLSIIGCMARPTSGRIYLRDIPAALPYRRDDSENVEITSLQERFLTEIRRRTFGFIFQQFNLIKGISVLENVMLPAYPTGEARSAFRTRALDLLGQFGMERHAGQKVELLSGGELQRTAIVRALINDPAIIIADEPTAHLDSKLSLEFMERVEQLKSNGTTVIIASHDPLVYDAASVDSLVEMRNGKVVGSRSRQ